MHITLLCAIASILLVFWSYTSLFAALRRGQKQPIATRLALCCASLLGFGSAVFGGHAWGDVAFGGINATLSVIAVWKTWKSHGSTSVSLVDGTCLTLSVVGSAMFACIHNPVIGAAFAIAADAVAFIPVIPGIRHRPEVQPVRTYAIGCAAAVVALSADGIQGSIGTGSAFTIYMMVIDVLLPVATLAMRAIRRRHNVPSPHPHREALQNL